MGSGSSKKASPTILKGFRTEPDYKEIPFRENKKDDVGTLEKDDVVTLEKDDVGTREKDDVGTIEMQDTSDDDTVLVSVIQESKQQTDDKEFVTTVDGTAKAKWPIRCLSKLDYNVNAYHGGCAGLLLVSTQFGGKGEETNVEAFLLSGGFDCNHFKHKSIFRAHEGHFSAENYLQTDERGIFNMDCNFGTNHLRLLTNDCCYGNLRNGTFTEGSNDESATVLPLNVNGNWNEDAGQGSGLTMILCSADDGDAAVYMVKSGFKDNKFLAKLFAGDDKFKFSLNGENLAVTGPIGSQYGLFHNRNNLTQTAEESHVFVAQNQTADGKLPTIVMEKVQGHATIIVLCSNSNGVEDSTASSMYYVKITDGKVASTKELAGVYGKSYRKSDFWTFEVKNGHLEVTGPDGPCKYGLMSNIHATRKELMSSIKQDSCIATGEDTQTKGNVKVTKTGVIGEVNKFSDIHIMWNHKVIMVLPGKQLKKEDGIYRFNHDWSEDETVTGLHMVRIFAARKHNKTDEEVFIELSGSPHQLTFQKSGVVYALNCGYQAYHAMTDIVYSSEFSQYANYDYDFNSGYQFKSFGCVKTNAMIPNSVLKTLDGFLYIISRNGHGFGDVGQKVFYKITDIPNGCYIFRLHTNNTCGNMVCNGNEVSMLINEHIEKKKDSLDILHFVGHTVDLEVQVMDGTFQFVTKALDQTFRHSEKIGAFALLDKNTYKEKSLSESQKKEEVQEKQKLADTVLPLSIVVTRKELTIVGWSPNLLVNASAESGNMKHWNTTGDFKIGVGGYNTEKTIETSHTWCEKYQEVNLLDHFSADYLDTAPEIQVVEWYHQGGCGGGFYSMKVDLLDKDGQVITSYNTGKIGSVYNNDWLEASHIFSNYGPGVRIVGFSSKGKDDKFWAGHFGIRMSGAEVRVKRETKPAADDNFSDIDFKGIDSEKKSALDKLVSQILVDNQEILKDFVEQDSIPVDKKFEKQTEIVNNQTLPRPIKKQNNKRKKREIRVFVSSTFRDFTKEREEIIKKAFREINRLCSDRGVFFTYVDLRWGITSEQTSDGKTIAICLQEIDRCRPYFICLMGDRFGWSQTQEKADKVLDMTYNYAIENHQNLTWIEKYRYDASVTTLEVFHGALNNPSAVKDKCFFYMRDPVKKEDVTEDQYKRMTSESDWHHQRQEWLKSEVLKHEELKVTRFKTATEVAELIKKDLEKCVNEDFPLGTELTKLEQQKEAHNAFAELRCRVYIGREDYFKTVDENRKKHINQPFVLLGESGSGKSAFVANWVKRVEDSEPETFMFVHFIGSSADSADYIKLIRRLFEEMKIYYGFDMQIPTSDSHLINEMGKWLRMAGARSKVVIVFDALNQLDDGSGKEDKMRTRKKLTHFPVDEDKFELKFINTYIGHGVFARQRIEKGEALLEYKGILTSDIQDDETGFKYYFKHNGKMSCIDATFSDGLGRMVNDQCQKKANCKMKKVIENGVKLWLYAVRDIFVGEQLTYDYGVKDLPWRKLKDGDTRPILYSCPNLYGEDITDAPAPLEDLNRENIDVGAGKQSCSKPDGDDDDDDDIMDPDYQPGKNGECQSSVDSDSDSQVTSSHVPMKRKRQSGQEHDLLWIPSELPPNVFMLLSTLPGNAMTACKNFGWPSMKVEPLDESQKGQILTDYLEGIYGKTLTQDQKDMIVNAKQTSNALYLKSLLDEVRMYGSFRTLTDKIREYLTADSPNHLFAKILERLEEDFEKGSNSSVMTMLNIHAPSSPDWPDLVRDATTALWCSNRGMSEAELTDFLNVTSAVWSPFYLSLFENLVNRDGILNFFHDHLRQAVEKKYLSTKEEKKNCYIKLADFFEKMELGNRKVEELPFLLMRAGELERLKATVSDLEIFFKMSDSQEGLFELVKAWKTLGDFSLAEEAYMKKLAMISRQEISQNSEHYCQLYSKLGHFFQNLGLMEAAKNIYMTLIKQLEMNYGISHGDIIYSAHNQSWTYRCKHTTVIKSLQELAAVYYKMGEYEKAVEIYTDAINRQTKLNTTSEKIQVCEGLLGLASVYIEQDRMDEAKKLMTRALELATEILGRTHRFVAAIFAKLGQLSYKQSRLEEALAFYLQDLKVTRSEVGTNHPHTATLLNEIALVYDDMNDVIAGKLYEAALTVILDTYGRKYVGTAIIRYNLGAFYFGTNHFEKARYQFEEAYQVLQAFLGEDHPDTVAAKQARDSVKG